MAPKAPQALPGATAPTDETGRTATMEPTDDQDPAENPVVLAWLESLESLGLVELRDRLAQRAPQDRPAPLVLRGLREALDRRDLRDQRDRRAIPESP